MARAPKSGRARASAAERSQDKERQILDAAVRVFARRGFHASRISDIAREADVAYGLVYHYFSSKEEVLSNIFQRNWSVLVKMMESVEENNTGLRPRLTAIIDFMVNVYKLSPETVEVLVLEFGRSSRVAQTVRDPAVDHSWAVLQRMFEDGRRDGEVRADMEPRVLTMLFFGLIETGLAAFVTRLFEPDERSLDEMKRYLVGTFIDGVAPRPAQPRTSGRSAGERARSADG